MKKPLCAILVAAWAFGVILSPTPAIPLVTTAGKNLAIQRLVDAASTPAIANYIGVGNGDGSGTCTSAAAGDTALQGEIGTRQQQTGPTPHPATAGTQSLVVTFSAGNATGSLCELGLLNASSSGTLAVRATFAVVTKGAGDSFQVTLTLTQS